MAFTLRPATIADAEALVEIYMSAFEHDLISKRVFPRSSPSSHEFWLSMLRQEIPEPDAHFLVITAPDPDVESGAAEQEVIVSFAKWNAPQFYPPSSQALPAWPEASDSVLADFFFGALVRKKLALVGDGLVDSERFWYLELIATRPGWQGKGAAGKLIRWGLERADRQCRKCYLEGSPDGKPVYERFGFREVDRLVVHVPDEEEFVEVFMIRDERREIGE